MKNFLLFGIIWLAACENKKPEILSPVSLCFIEGDTMYLKIQNKLNKPIYIPEKYTGTYRLGSDTVYLLPIDRPEFNLHTYYIYSKILPFRFITGILIPNHTPDSIINKKTQTYYFNQFIPPTFLALNANCDTTLQIVFDIPDHCRIVKTSYYETPFKMHRENVTNNIDNTFEEFKNFDSSHIRYSTTRAISISPYWEPISDQDSQ